MFPVECRLQRRLARLVAASLGCFMSLFLGLGVSVAHEGHDHADKSSAVSSAYPRVVARSDLYEIVGVVKDRQLSIFVDDAVTNEPVADAALQVTVGDSGAIEARAEGNGVYTAMLPDRKSSGPVEIIFSVAAAKGDDLLVDSLALPPSAGPLQKDEHGWLSTSRNAALLALAALVAGLTFGYSRRRGHKTVATASGLATAVFVVLAAFSFGESRNGANDANAHAAQPPSDAPKRMQDGSAFAAKTTQRLLDVRTAVAEQQTIRPAVNLIGRVIADPDRSSIVQSVYGGRVVPNEGAIPRIGQAVSKGEILVQIEPLLPLADRTTILEKVGEIEQLIAVAENKVRRLRPLAERGAVPQGQLNDLESELEGLRARRETVRNSRAGFEVLRASTDGIITSAKVVPGQVIQPQDVLFMIADPKSLWVEALAYDDIGLNGPAGATAMTHSGQPIALSFLGNSRALRQHASVVHFAIPAPPADLNIGQPLTVMVQSGAPVTGLIFPRDAIVRNSNGENIVWLHTAAERFEPKPVRVLPVDATRVIVAAGVNPRDRVVVRGTDLINQIR